MSVATIFAARKSIVLALIWFAYYSGMALAQQEIVTLPTRPGVTQSYFLTSSRKSCKRWQCYFPAPAA